MSETTDPSTDLAGWRRGADRGFAYLASLFMLGVLVQFFLAGVGVFGNQHGTALEHASSFDAHRGLGFALGGVAVLLLLLALGARASRATVIGSLVLAVLAFVLQSVLAGAGDHNKWVGGLHAFDGVVILLLGGWLTAAAHRREATRRRARAAQ